MNGAGAAASASRLQHCDGYAGHAVAPARLGELLLRQHARHFAEVFGDAGRRYVRCARTCHVDNLRTITMRLRAPPPRATAAASASTPTFGGPDARLYDEDLPLKYDLQQQEVEIDDARETSGALNAYVVEEPVGQGRAENGRAVVLLGGSSGWRHQPTRRLADRLAVFCSCMVLLPDLLRGAEPWPAEPHVRETLGGSGGYATWLSALPPDRADADIRASVIYLRADQRKTSIALVGLGLGGEQAPSSSRGATRPSSEPSATHANPVRSGERRALLARRCSVPPRAKARSPPRAPPPSLSRPRPTLS